MDFLREKLNRYLYRLLPSADENILFESMHHAVFGGGKRLRPLLLLTAYHAFQDEENDGPYIFASAIELIHSYSLVHDDLPSLDNDDFRRNKPTVHKKYGEAVAVLCGDALLNLAYETMSKWILHDLQNKYCLAMNMIAEAAGVLQMVEGQAIDILQNIHTLDDLINMEKKKTAALIASSVLSGLCLAKPQTDYSFLKEPLLNLGLAFQMQDDILDEFGNGIGKPRHSDQKNQKRTFLHFMEVEKVNELIDVYYETCRQEFEKIGMKNTQLLDLFTYMQKREY